MPQKDTCPDTLAPDGSIRPFVINNCVATCNVGHPLRLSNIITSIRASKYNPKIFAAMEIKINDPPATALIFGSGKFVVSGCRTIEMARLSVAIFIDILEKIGLNVDIARNQFKIQNIVSTTWIGHDISLPKLYATFQKESIYEPELFPGLTFRPQSTNMVLLIFGSGKIVLTGAKVKRDLDEGYRILMDILQEYMTSTVNVLEWEKRFKVKKRKRKSQSNITETDQLNNELIKRSMVRETGEENPYIVP